MNLELYFAKLMLRELGEFRDRAITPPEGNAAEVAQPDPLPLFATAQDPTTDQTSNRSSFIDGDEDTQPCTDQQPQDITALVDADEAANGFQGKPVKLITLRSTTDRQRKINGARQQRIYRLAQKLGVAPGGPRWARSGRPHVQPAVPRSVVRADGTVEYNQFMYDEDWGRVVLRMPGGWRRDLVRNRREFIGVAVVDGFLWPRFSRNLERKKTVDWGKLLTLFFVLWCVLRRKLTFPCWQRSRASSS